MYVTFTVVLKSFVNWLLSRGKFVGFNIFFNKRKFYIRNNTGISITVRHYCLSAMFTSDPPQPRSGNLMTYSWGNIKKGLSSATIIITRIPYYQTDIRHQFVKLCTIVLYKLQRVTRDAVRFLPQVGRHLWFSIWHTR